jgi:hypothetical protein
MFLLLGNLLVTASLFAQQKKMCGAEIVRQHILNNGTNGANLLAHRQQQLDLQNQQAFHNGGGLQRPTGSIQIPVVFHIILNAAQINQLGDTQGIINRINTQIEVLNEDFNALNADSSNIPAYFKPYFGNAQIQFGLAHTDPNENATEGYEIITTTESGFTNMNGGYPDAKYAATGGINAWDVIRYLNIWVINPLDGGLLGLTLPPLFTGVGGYPTVEMGVVLNYLTLGRRTGSSQLFISNFDQGRTLTHEIGHYFELNHIWGDDGGLCPGEPNGHDDGIADTPPQAGATSGKPSLAAPYYDACSASGNGIMFMNFMDYVDDAGMLLFTVGQANRMIQQLAAGGESYVLGIHPELLAYPSGVHDLSKKQPILLGPNPATTILHVTFNRLMPAATILILNQVGALVQTINAANPTTLTIDLATLPRGLYFVKIKYDDAVLTQKIILQ